MTYTIARDGATLGTFDEAEVRQGVTDGRFTAHDYAWTDGLPSWQTVGQIFGIPAAPVPPPLPLSVANPFPQAPVQAQPDIGDSMGMRLLLPVGRSGWAIAAGYMGLFSLMIFPAPFALIVSIIAIRDIQKSKKAGGRPKYGMGRAIFGLIVGLLGTICLVLIILTQALQRRP